MPLRLGMATKITIRQRTIGERAVPGGRRIDLELRDGDDAVPAVLLLPDAEGPVAGAVMLHGYSSRKEHMTEGLGLPLLRRGVATLSLDLPMHGTRTDPLQAQSARNPLAMVGLWRQAVRETRLSLHYLRARAEVDAGRVGLVGYSLGSFLSVAVAADDARVRAVVLAAGGDLPAGTPLTAVARTVADPVRAVRRLAGRPLLMVNGRDDRTIRPEQAERLFAAAGEPKEIRWWPSGHVLPAPATDFAADWLTERLAAPAAPA